MGKLRTVSKVFLITVNSLMALVSLAILGGGLYVYLNYQVFSGFISEEAILYVACSGAIVFLFCLLGLLGAICDQAKFLCPYLIGIVLVIAGEVVVGIIALNYLGVLDNTAIAVGNNSTLDATETAINNFILKSYQTCCVLNEAFCPALACQEVLFCEVAVPQPCIDEPVLGGSTLVDSAICSALQGFDLQEGSDLVGPVPDSCGGGDPAVFIAAL